MPTDWSLCQRLRRAVPLLAIAIGLAFLFYLPPALVQASFMHCRTDPIITLSNGDIITIIVDADTDPSQIQRIDYTLQVPPGVTATNVIYAGDTGFPETLTLKQTADSEYVSQTIVRTAKSVPVTVTMSLGGDTDTSSGSGGKKLTASINIEG